GASWNSQQQAWAQTQAQLEWYREMESEGYLRQLTDGKTLADHLASWNKNPSKCPIGMVRSLEGADSIVTLNHLERAYSDGLRIIGPAHYGPGVYAFGTDSEGGIGRKGRELLELMDELGMIMDASHLCDLSFWEAMDHFKGPVWASHSNCRALVPHNRQFSDEQLKALIARGAVIGTAMDAWMLTSSWKRGISTPEEENVSLRNVADHIDHVCELAGNSRHAGIGSDLDGAYGKEQSPYDIDTIADLQKLSG
ncbi:MAG: membrane dipeptidase, partial [Cyclobacteriaceae bacterium]